MSVKRINRHDSNSTGGLEDIERSAFYTLRNIIPLLAISSASAIALSFFVGDPFSVFSIPFFAYAAVCIVLLIVSARGKVEPSVVVLVKVVADLLLTVYWINVHVWKTGSALFYFLPIITLLTDVLFTSRFGRQRLIHIGIYAVVLINGVVYLLLAGYDRYTLPSGAVYFLLTGMAIWAHIMHSHLKMQLHSDLKSKEERIDTFVNSRKTFSLSARIVSHEISNEMMSLSHCSYLLKHRKTENFDRELEDIKRCMDNIPKYLKMLSEQDTAPVALLAVLKVVFPGKYATVDVAAEAEVKVSMPLLVSFVNNIYENALQAYERKFGNLEGFHIDVSLDGTALVIDDNAGGFDMAEIALGKSCKGPGHGIFLATFLTDTGHLGLHPSIERTERGTRVKIVFDHFGNPG